MTVTQKSSVWVVINNSGKVVASFPTNEQAWRWLDRHEVQPSYLRRATAERCGLVDVKP